MKSSTQEESVESATDTSGTSRPLAKRLGTVLLVGLFATSMLTVGCDNDNDVGDALDEVGDKIEQGADEVKDAVKDTVD